MEIKLHRNLFSSDECLMLETSGRNIYMSSFCPFESANRIYPNWYPYSRGATPMHSISNLNCDSDWLSVEYQWLITSSFRINNSPLWLDWILNQFIWYWVAFNISLHPVYPGKKRIWKLLHPVFSLNFKWVLWKRNTTFGRENWRDWFQSIQPFMDKMSTLINSYWLMQVVITVSIKSVRRNSTSMLSSVIHWCNRFYYNSDALNSLSHNANSWRGSFPLHFIWIETVDDETYYKFRIINQSWTQSIWLGTAAYNNSLSRLSLAFPEEAIAIPDWFIIDLPTTYINMDSRIGAIFTVDDNSYILNQNTEIRRDSLPVSDCCIARVFRPDSFTQATINNINDLELYTWEDYKQDYANTVVPWFPFTLGSTIWNIAISNEYIKYLTWYTHSFCMFINWIEIKRFYRENNLSMPSQADSLLVPPTDWLFTKINSIQLDRLNQAMSSNQSTTSIGTSSDTLQELHRSFGPSVTNISAFNQWIWEDAFRYYNSNSTGWIVSQLSWMQNDNVLQETETSLPETQEAETQEAEMPTETEMPEETSSPEIQNETVSEEEYDESEEEYEDEDSESFDSF